MKINSISVRFCGIKKPYHTKNGYEIRPINFDPTKEQIKSAISAAKRERLIGKGLNGEVYPYPNTYLGRDLVVKKYYPQDKLLNKEAFDCEFEKLDMLYEKGVKSDNIQQGGYAFVTPRGEKYLVSTRVRGQKPDFYTNKLNEENLYQIMQALIELDMPRKNENSGNFPYDVLMHYDLTAGNIIVNKNSAGIVDFEYLRSENLDEYYKRGKEDFQDANCNFSDIACLPSNLRGFEYRTLLPYLLNAGEIEATNLFDIYLENKSLYHKKRADFYSSHTEDKIFKELYNKESAHSAVLKNPDYDVKKAEAIKMQIASFMYVQSPFEKIPRKINVRQIHNYLDYALSFFEEKAKDKNLDKNHKIYYQDGLELVKKWQGLHQWMDYQANTPSQEVYEFIEYLKPEKQKEISKQVYKYVSKTQDIQDYDHIRFVYDDDKKSVKADYDKQYPTKRESIEEYKKTGIISNTFVTNINRKYLAQDFEGENYRLFQLKLSDEYIQTLDKHLGL